MEIGLRNTYKYTFHSLLTSVLEITWPDQKVLDQIKTSFALLPFKRGASVQKLTNERYGAVVSGSDIGA